MENWKQRTGIESGIHKWSRKQWFPGVNSGTEITTSTSWRCTNMVPWPVNQKVLSFASHSRYTFGGLQLYLCSTLHCIVDIPAHSLLSWETQCYPRALHWHTLSQTGLQWDEAKLFFFFPLPIRSTLHTTVLSISPVQVVLADQQAYLGFVNLVFLFPSPHLDGASTRQRGRVKCLRMKCQRVRLNMNFCYRC